METNYNIRKATPADANNIFRFISHLEEQSFEEVVFKEKYEINLKKPDVIYLVAANDEDEAIGFISCHGQSLLHHEGKVFEIQEMYVAKNYRGHGIDHALLQSVVETLEKTDCESLEVTTNSIRTDARRFYTKLGFIQTHIKFTKKM